MSNVNCRPRNRFCEGRGRVRPGDSGTLRRVLVFNVLYGRTRVRRGGGRFIVSKSPARKTLLMTTVGTNCGEDDLLGRFRVVGRFPFSSTQGVVDIIMGSRGKERFVMAGKTPSMLIKGDRSIL